MAQPPPMFEVKCPCGWSDTFSRGYAGLVIECRQCGKIHRIPILSTTGADDLDPALLRRMMARADLADMNEKPTVNLRPFFLASIPVCALAAAASLLFDPFYPMGVVVIGGALSWPLALWVAWLGQRRQLRKGPPPGA